MWGDNTFGTLGAGNVSSYYSWAQISAGGTHNVALRSDGILFAWGANNQGQLGDGTTIDRSSPVQVGINDSWIAASAGNQHTVAIRNDYTLWGWGNNTFGQLANLDILSNFSNPVLINNYLSFTQVSAGAYHNAAITTNGELYTWGYDATGQIGDRKSFVQIFAVQSAAAAIKSDGTLWTWGVNASGQLGVGDAFDRSSPVQVPGSWNSIAVANNSTAMAGIKNDGTLWVWGSNLSGQLGLNLPSTSRVSPVQLGNQSNWIGVAAGQQSFFYWNNIGTIFAVGNNGAGALGDGTTAFRSSPVQISTFGSNIAKILAPNDLSTAFGTTYVLLENGSLYGWGYNAGGQLGLGDTVSRSNPVQIPGSYINVASGPGGGSGVTILGLTPSYQLFAWGNNEQGQYGNQTLISRSSPVQIGTTSWTNIYSASAVFYGYKAGDTNTLWGWGVNFSGQLGDNTLVDKNSPIVVYSGPSIKQITGSAFAGTFILRNDGAIIEIGGPGRSNPVQTAAFNPQYQPYLNKVGNSSYVLVSAGKFGTAAITKDYKLITWGLNNYGQIGDNTTINRSSPVQIGTSSWSVVSTNGSYSAAIRSDGGLFTWGINNLGQLGNNSVATDLFWDQVVDGGNHAMALRSDGRLFAWGRNNNGQLGDGTTINRSSPVQIGNNTWLKVSGGFQHTAAVRSDGTLWTWGNNTFGQLGTGDDTTGRWTLISIGITIIGIRNDGTLWGWGNGAGGKLGQGDTIERDSPVQIGVGNSWIDVSVADQVLAIRNDYTLWAWGFNTNGGYGNNSTVAQSSPIQVTTPTRPIKVFTGKTGLGDYSAYIDNNSRLYMFGLNSGGELGDGTTINRSAPIQIPGSWTMVSMGEPTVNNSNTIGIKTDGTLWAWGVNSNGQLGDGTTISRSSPVQIGSSSYIQVTSNGLTTLAITVDNRLFAWGSGSPGYLGQNDTINRSSPVQIPGSYVQVLIGQSVVVAQRSNGTLWTWGNNGNGQLGDQSTISRSSPVQIGSTSETWSLTGIKLKNSANVAGAFKNNNLYWWGAISAVSNFMNLDGAAISSRSSPVQIGFSLQDYSSPVQVGTRTDWRTVAAGGNHTLAIDNAGAVWGWGRKYEGQLGNTLYLNTTTWKKLAGGTSDFVLAISPNDVLYAWGLGTTGQLGDGSTISRSSPLQIGSEKYIDVTAGPSHALAIRQDGTVWGWGANNTVATVAAGGFSWVQVVSGTEASHVVAIRSDNTLWSWGLNSEGQLGDGTTVSRSSPVQLWTTPVNATPLIAWSTAVVGRASTYVLRNDGVLFSFGRNAEGQLGDNTTVNRSSPVQIGTNNNFTKLTAGGYLAGFITNTNTLFVTGLNSSGQLGLNDTINRSSPVQLGTYSVASASSSHMLAIGTDGSLWSWGANTNGQLGDGLTVTRSSPVQIGSLSYTVVSASVNNSYGITNNNQLFAWGRGNEGQLGQSDTISRSSPVQISGSFINVVAGNSYAMALDTVNRLFGWGNNTNNQTVEPYAFSALAGTTAGLLVNRLYMWGPNASGQLGVNDVISRSAPIQINNDSWIQVTTEGSALRAYTLAIKSNNTLWAWGLNTSGQLGDNTTISKSSPVQIPGSWSVVRAARLQSNITTGYFTVAINTQGQLYTWGDNNFSSCQLGTGDYDPRSSPTQIGTFASWSQIDAGSEFTLATTSDGRLYGWGNNLWGAINNSPNLPLLINTSSILYNSGQLFAWGNNGGGAFGLGDTTARSAPIQISAPATTLWKTFSAWLGPTSAISSSTNLFGIRASDNTLWAAGSNGVGTLGDNTTVNKSTFVQIGSNAWSKIVTNNANVLAIRSDGTLWGWGNNVYGTVGDSSVVRRSSPVQVGSETDWKDVFSTGQVSFGLKNDNRLYVWGFNSVGQLGLNDVVSRSSPVQLPGSYIAAAGTGNHSVVLKTDYTLWSFGYNTSGEIGDNTTINKSSPVQIPGSWIQVVGGTTGLDTVVHAIRLDRTLWTWGAAYLTQGTGANSTIARSSPVQVGTSSWAFIGGTANVRLGMYLGSAVSNLVAWGVNANGNVGDNTTVDKNSPVTVTTTGFANLFLNQTAITSPTLIDNGSWSVITAGMQFSAAVNSLNTLFTWGRNSSGELGSNTTVFRSSPVQLATSIIRAAAGDGVLAYINNLGQLFTVGTGFEGVLGSNATVSRSSPVQVGTSSWSQIWSAARGFSAVTTDNRLFGWGKNDGGQLGDNTTANRSSPVQIGSLNQQLSSPTQVGLNTGLISWTTISTGLNASYGIPTNYLGYTWGVNNNGQLGLNDTINRTAPTFANFSLIAVDRSSPVQVLSGSWSSVMATNFNGAAVIRNDKTLWVWGTNTNGELGDGTTINRSTPTQIAGSWNQVVTGSGWMAGLKTNNTLWVWGNLTGGLLANFTQTYRSSPVQIGTSSWLQLAAGTSHLIALATDNKVYGWGQNTVGQAVTQTKYPRQWTSLAWFDDAAAFGINTLGQLYVWGRSDSGAGYGYTDNGTALRSSPVQVGVGLSFSMLPAKQMNSNSHMAVVDTNMNVWIWGWNDYGQLGLGDRINRFSPTLLSSFAGVSISKVVLSREVSFLLTTNGTLYSWGNNGQGTLGLGDIISRSSPVQIPGVWKDIQSGAFIAAGLKSDDTLWGWGYNGEGTLGDNTIANRSSPVQILSGRTFSKIGLSRNASSLGGTLFAITTNNLMFAMGLNASGELGDNTTISRSSPVQIAGSWRDVYPTAGQTYAINTSGTLWAWGAGGSQGFGDGLTVARSSPVQTLSGVNDINTVYMGFQRVLVYTNNGAAYYWGNNSTNLLGDSTTGNKSQATPVGYEQVLFSPVLLDSNSYTSVFAQANNSAALRINNTLWVWGDNSAGQLGQTTLANGGPFQYQSSFTFTNAGVGGSNIFGLSTNHTFAAGRNATGSLGDTTTVNKSSPVIVTTSLFKPILTSPTHIGTSSWSQVSAGFNHTMLIDPNYLLYGMGNNATGQLGDNTVVTRSSPTQVGTSSWISVSAGTSFTGAIRTNNSLWMWGNNAQGQLGDNTTVNKSSPVQISGYWIDVEAGISHAAAISYANSLFVWGTNSLGALNTNSILPRSSPVQVGTSYYKNLAVTENSTTATDVYGNILSFGSNQFGQLGNNNV